MHTYISSVIEKLVRKPKPLLSLKMTVLLYRLYTKIIGQKEALVDELMFPVQCLAFL